MATEPSFDDLAGDPDAPLGALTLAIASAFHAVDAEQVQTRLDELGAELARDLAARPKLEPADELRAVGHVLGTVHGFAGDRQRYDDPRNSMLDLVLTRRRGLPILLSIVYVEVAHRAAVALSGVGLAGHFVVGHFGVAPPVLADPFAGGALLDVPGPIAAVRPWTPAEIATRVLTNLVASFQRRGNVGAAIQAAQMRLALPAGDAEARDALEHELRTLRANLN